MESIDYRTILQARTATAAKKKWDMKTALASYHCLNPPTPFEEWRAACDWLLKHGSQNIKTEVRQRLGIKRPQLSLVKA